MFRHIPSGKSFTKPPKNLFNNNSSTATEKPTKKSNKRKVSNAPAAAAAVENVDDSVYNFEDDFGAEFGLSQPPPAKVAKDVESPNK